MTAKQFSTCFFRFASDHGLVCGPLEQMFAYATPGLEYGDIFECRYIFEPEDENEPEIMIIAWWLRFYRWTVFRCFVKR